MHFLTLRHELRTIFAMRYQSWWYKREDGSGDPSGYPQRNRTIIKSKKFSNASYATKVLPHPWVRMDPVRCTIRCRTTMSCLLESTVVWNTTCAVVWRNLKFCHAIRCPPCQHRVVHASSRVNKGNHRNRKERRARAEDLTEWTLGLYTNITQWKTRNNAGTYSFRCLLFIIRRNAELIICNKFLGVQLPGSNY